MAFTRFTKNVLNVSALPDRVQNQAQTLKATFDQAGVDIKVALNALIAELEASTSADNIGADVQSVATKTVQAILTAFEEEIANRYTKTEAETLIATGTNDLVADIDVNLTTGIITVTKKDGTVIPFDTAIEKVPAKFEIVENGDTYALKITNVDGTSTVADITNFMNIYNFNNSDHITFEVTGEGTEKTVTANIKANSIGLDKLSLSVVSTLEGYMNSAKDSATAAKTSETNARASELSALEAENTATTKAAEASASADEAEYWAKQAQAGGGGITEIPVATTDTLGGIKVGSGLNITEDGVLSSLGGQASGASSNPIGTVIPFIGTTPPKDYLTCDGTVYNIADYLELASHFEAQFGSKNKYGGDGVTTFAVPDLRNEFIRGYGDLSGEIGEHQDATEHPFFTTNSTGAMLMTFQQSSGVNATMINADTLNQGAGNWKTVNLTNGNSDTRETRYTARPTNVAVLFCIKYTVSSEEIEIESTPTEGSNKVVTSGGVKEYVDSKMTYGTEDLVAGTSELATGTVYLCYE